LKFDVVHHENPFYRTALDENMPLIDKPVGR
jgi:hypothetical protein